MSSEDHSFTEFLEDYYSESEEHLGSIRRHLLVLEAFVDRDDVDPDLPAVVDELLRALHSLKGLSGMAGIQAAEKVAHAMEECLRAMKHAGTSPTDSAMEVLAEGAGVIEQVVAARREQKPAPNIEIILSRLTSGISTAERLWCFQFTPSVELSARGINVNSIRARLQEIGPVRSATPRIVEGGQITFDFIVATHADGFSDQQLDGLTVALHNSPATESTDVHEMTPTPSPPSIVRVDMRRLDHLMTMVGDMVISRGHLEESLRRLDTILPASAWRELQEANLLMRRQLSDLREGVMHARMVPIGRIFERMRFAIRGLERESHKHISLELTGHGTEIDKVLVDRLMDPLLHMVRNAVSHGLESAEERMASGKPKDGHLRICAGTEGETVVIELEDDGRGMDIEQVANRSRALGLTELGESPTLLEMICAPGLSTREEADLESGRGVGMTVVKTTIDALGGTLAMETQPGRGTRFIIRLPLTLAIMQALIICIDNQPFAVARSAIQEVLRIETHTVTLLDNNEVIPYRGGVLPIVHLRRFFQISEKAANSFHVFVTGRDAGAVGIAVDRITGQREIVVRSIEDALVRVPGIAGATELGDGKPVLILDVPAIIDAFAHRPYQVAELPS